MVVSFLPILDLGLEHLGWNAGRVLEHEPAAEHTGPDQSEESHDAQHACERELLRRHLKTPEQTPGEHDGKQRHRQQRHILVLFHDFVNRFTMLDGVRRDFSGDDRRP